MYLCASLHDDLKFKGSIIRNAFLWNKLCICDNMVALDCRKSSLIFNDLMDVCNKIWEVIYQYETTQHLKLRCFY